MAFMKYTIGDKEKHELEINTNWLGKETIRVNGSIVSDRYNFSTHGHHTIKIGEEEPHSVDIFLDGKGDIIIYTDGKCSDGTTLKEHQIKVSKKTGLLSGLLFLFSGVIVFISGLIIYGTLKITLSALGETDNLTRFDNWLTGNSIGRKEVVINSIASWTINLTIIFTALLVFIGLIYLIINRSKNKEKKK